MRYRLATIITLLITTGIMAQNQPADAPKKDGQVSQTILETEKELDQAIAKANENMTRHTPLFKMKLNVLPFRTLVFKGKDNGKECEMNPNQTDPANNCIRVEVYDFINDEYLYPTINRGKKFKYMELYYAGANSNNPDPTQEAPRKLTRIKSKVYSNDFFDQTKRMSDVIDTNPNGQPAHDAEIFLFTQINDYPEKELEENMSEKGVGKFKLSNVENTKTNQIRNQFKQTYYIKYLDYFNRLFTKIYDYNDRDSNSKYKETVKMLKESLEY